MPYSVNEKGGRLIEDGLGLKNKHRCRNLISYKRQIFSRSFLIPLLERTATTWILTECSYLIRTGHCTNKRYYG